MDKALIEKAREWCEQPENAYIGEQAAFIAGASWQREQDEKKIEKLVKELKYATDTIASREKWISDLQEVVANATHAQHEAEQKLKDYLDEDNSLARTELIQELREWANKKIYRNVLGQRVGEDNITIDEFLAKLDLLEGEVSNELR